MNPEEDQLRQLFLQWAGVPCTECLALGANGSSRRYYRLFSSPLCEENHNTLSSPLCEENHNTLSSPLCERGRGVPQKLSAIGCLNDDLRENEAFFAYSRHLHAKGMPVPELYAVAPDRCCYLQQDLGDQTLYGLLLDKKRQGGGFDAEMLGLYKQALADLAAIQQAGADLDFSLAYPRPAFDRQSILWDLNYFKYHFLKLTDTSFDEQLLENDFSSLADFLLQADCGYFLYRDFNPRNIMLVASPPNPLSSKERGGGVSPLLTGEGQGVRLYYIDYQGGRRGAAQYDVASLLYSAKSDLPEAIRQELLNHYLDVRNLRGQERSRWLAHFWGYVLVRILQTLGAYGYRGLFQRKDYFLQSIPLALNNLRQLHENHPDLFANLPEISRVTRLHVGTWRAMSAPVGTGRALSAPVGTGRALSVPVGTGRAMSAKEVACPKTATNAFPHSHIPTLTVTVQSFSFKQGLPSDPSGNGGGFIFDCRALPNPGRYAQYKTYTGKDRPVIEFLQREPAVARFLDNAKALVCQSIDKYLERQFTHLQVSFGCTGGQHRSVYCAEQLAAHLSASYPNLNIILSHREQDKH